MNHSLLRAAAFSLMAAASASAKAAFFTADVPNPNAGAGRGTHLIVVGKGLEVGDQWLRAAHTQAMIFKDRRGLGQIKIISAIENANYSTLVKNWGYTNVKAFNRTMTGNEVLGQIFAVANTSMIESIDFVGHNGAFFGFALEDYNNRFYLTHAKELAKIRHRMSADAIVRLMGCNTGWYLAPAVANALNVPTAGTFTYSDIQELHSSGEWFYHDAGRFPTGGSWVKTNPISFSETKTCIAKGGCMRLKVVNSNYQGRHGSYGGTLPFMKYFCGGLGTNDCHRRMAKGLIHAIGVKGVTGKPSLNDFSEMVADEFCPAFIDDLKRQSCRKKVVEHMLGINVLPATFSTVTGTSMTCDFQSCQMKKDCSSGSCVVTSSTQGPSRTYVNELNAFRRGYDLM
ncbi:MAG: hypothetical protein KF767_01000 [Bdellovibrionaceae bacterium]|nr:hypothetical protein [Pseudobdellovibrionaceae bacterium]